MRSSIEADIQATLDNRITGAAKTWVDEAVRPLAQSAMAQKTAILSAARKTREDLVAQDQVLRDELAKLDAKRREAQAAADAVARELEAAQKDHDALATKLEGLKADRGKAASDLSALQTQAEGEGRTGKGERYNNLVVELNTLKSKLEGLTANVTQTETALQAATQRLDAAKVNANDNVEARTLAAIQDDAKKKVASRAELASQIKTAETGAAFDFDSQEGKLDTELNALNSRDFAAIERISEVCNQVKQMLGTLDRGGSQGTDCSNAEIAKAVEAAKAQRTKLADFEASCIKQPAQIEEVEGKDAKINGVIDQLNSCLSKVVSDQVVREELNVRIATLKAQRGDNVDPITMAKVALSQDMQGNAVMSAFFAVIIELLVLLCSLMGQMAGLSQRVRGIDVVITKARPVAGGHAVYERQLDLTSLSPKQKASVENVVGELIRRELVDLVDQEGNLLMLKRGGMTQLVQLRNSAAAPVAQSGTANPAAAGPVTNQPKKRRGLRN